MPETQKWQTIPINLKLPIYAGNIFKMVLEWGSLCKELHILKSVVSDMVNKPTRRAEIWAKSISSSSSSPHCCKSCSLLLKPETHKISKEVLSILHPKYVPYFSFSSISLLTWTITIPCQLCFESRPLISNFHTASQMNLLKFQIIESYIIIIDSLSVYLK